MASMNLPPSVEPSAIDGAPRLDAGGRACPDNHRLPWLELEIAQEQLKLLQESLRQADAQLEQLTSELRLLPWNWARLIRDARQALASAHADLGQAQNQAEQSRHQLQTLIDALAAAEADRQPGTGGARSRALGLLVRQRRRLDGTLLDLRVSHALANERLRADLDRLQEARLRLKTVEPALTDVMSRRRRHRSILIQDIEALQQRRQREEIQMQDCERGVAALQAVLEPEPSCQTLPA